MLEQWDELSGERRLPGQVSQLPLQCLGDGHSDHEKLRKV